MAAITDPAREGLWSSPGHTPEALAKKLAGDFFRLGVGWQELSSLPRQAMTWAPLPRVFWVSRYPSTHFHYTRIQVEMLAAHRLYTEALNELAKSPFGDVQRAAITRIFGEYNPLMFTDSGDSQDRTSLFAAEMALAMSGVPGANFRVNGHDLFSRMTGPGQGNVYFGIVQGRASYLQLSTARVLPQFIEAAPAAEVFDTFDIMDRLHILALKENLPRAVTQLYVLKTRHRYKGAYLLEQEFVNRPEASPELSPVQFPELYRPATLSAAFNDVYDPKASKEENYEALRQSIVPAYVSQEFWNYTFPPTWVKKRMHTAIETTFAWMKRKLK